MELNSKLFFSLFVLYFVCLSSIQSLMFYLPVNTRKCLKEEIHKDVLVKGEYELTEIPGHHTKLEVVDSKNHILYNKDEARVNLLSPPTNTTYFKFVLKLDL